MDTAARVDIYTRSGRALTPAQRRRMIKKAGPDPRATVIRDDGMGFSPAAQGLRMLVGYERAVRPVSGIPGR